MNTYLPLVVAFGGGLVLGILVAPTDTEPGGVAPESASESEVLAFDFATHIELDMPEQDVYLGVSDDDAQVMRPDQEAAADPHNLDRMVYAAAQEVPHNPFMVGEKPLGPFSKGEALGFTLGEWLAGTGSGTYTEQGGVATLDVSFSNLVPDGVYTLWCANVKLPPDPSGVDLPCGAIDGSNNTVVADADGDASLTIDMKPLELSTELTVKIIALAYHSDDNTYGPNPGPFGEATHVQLAYILPTSIE